MGSGEKEIASHTESTDRFFHFGRTVILPDKIHNHGSFLNAILQSVAQSEKLVHTSAIIDTNLLQDMTVQSVHMGAV